MMHPACVRWPARCALAALFALLACRDAPTATTGSSGPVDLSVEWRDASPESQSIDAGALAAAVAHARTLPRLTSLLVVRHGRLVAEEYFNGSRADSMVDVRSVTKSVVSTLVGIAINSNLLPGVSTRIDGYLDAAHLAGLSESKRAITVQHLLSMSSGFEWDESTTAEYNAWVVAPDPVAYLLARPLIFAPGQRFTYNTAAVHLLSVVLESATGMRNQDFAKRYLFSPLGIANFRWELFADGRVNGGAGLSIRPRDMAKLGAFWLQGGDAGMGNLVAPDWMAKATSHTFAYWTGQLPLAEQNYGYLLWLDRRGGQVSFFAWGYGGQFIWVDRTRDLVVVATTEWRNAGTLSHQLEVNGLDLIVNHVLPAVH